MALKARLLKPSPYQILDRSPEIVGPWMQQHGGGYWRTGTTCIGLARHGELIAATMYDYFNGASIVAHIVIRGPVIRKWLWYIFYYPFIQLNAKTIIGMVAQDNLKSQRLVERFGFQLQAPLPECDPSGSLYIYLLHRDKCRFLRRPYGKTESASRT